MDLNFEQSKLPTNVKFESYLEANKDKLPKALKTGTTIAGCVFKGGVVLGADTRATADTIVAIKNCEKIHYIAKNIYCGGAGTAADTEYVTKMVSAQLKTYMLTVNNPEASLSMARTLLSRYLFQYQGHVSAALIVGGVDKKGSHLYSIAPHGSTMSLPYVTMGSGSLAALSVLEARYTEDMNVEEAKTLVKDAILAGIFNDLGSGSNVDICVIMKDSTQYLRPYDIANVKAEKESYKYPKGTTAIRKSVRTPIEVVSTTRQRIEPMEE